MTHSPTPVAPTKSPDLIPLGDGLNFASPLEQVTGTVVPTPIFFVRSNNPPPSVHLGSWSIQIDGLVRKPVRLTLTELQQMRTVSEEVWMECAGNSRVRWDPPAEGNQWGETAVGNAVFTGVPLRDVLRMADVLREAVELVATGADKAAGEETGFQRGLPVDVALQPHVLLAWEMNGEPIPPPNGGPVRLVVPRWAGIASVKWPVRLELVDRPFAGYYNAQRYIVVDDQGVTRRTIREMPVKSIFAWPHDGARVTAGQHTLFGFAWSGYGTIARVEVSVDGSAAWSEAVLTPGAGELAWTRWSYVWQAAPGAASLAVRATDSAGNVQPMQATWNKFGYEMNAVATRTVQVA
jgi:sulfite dehydrogenase